MMSFVLLLVASILIATDAANVASRQPVGALATSSHRVDQEKVQLRREQALDVQSQNDTGAVLSTSRKWQTVTGWDCGWGTIVQNSYVQTGTKTFNIGTSGNEETKCAEKCTANTQCLAFDLRGTAGGDQCRLSISTVLDTSSDPENRWMCVNKARSLVQSNQSQSSYQSLSRRFDNITGWDCGYGQVAGGSLFGASSLIGNNAGNEEQICAQRCVAKGPQCLSFDVMPAAQGDQCRHSKSATKDSTRGNGGYRWFCTRQVSSSSASLAESAEGTHRPGQHSMAHPAPASAEVSAAARLQSRAHVPSDASVLRRA